MLFQNFSAKLMPSYGTLKDIRSKKGLLTSDREKFDNFREKWSNVLSPAMYFETKFERPVGFDEFSSAVVPTTASNEVKQALRNAGVQIYEYDKEKECDLSRAFNEAINSSDTIRFSLDKDKGTVVSPSKPSKAEAVLRDAVIDRLRENGMEVITDVAEGQRVLYEVDGRKESICG